MTDRLDEIQTGLGGTIGECDNCDGRKCMGCVFRERDHTCADDCPVCCSSPEPKRATGCPYDYIAPDVTAERVHRVWGAQGFRFCPACATELAAGENK